MTALPLPPRTYREQRKRLRPPLPYLNELRLDRDKAFAKETVAALGFRTPRSLNGVKGLSFVSKPVDSCGARGVIVVLDGVVRLGSRFAGILEEAIIDENGQIPPRDFKLYCFGHQPKVIQVIDRSTRKYSYYLPEDWSAVRGICPRSWRDQVAPSCLSEMVSMGTELSRLFHFPVRVDCYAAQSGAVFGEFCLTSGIYTYISREADRLFGEWWREHFEAKGIQNEFDPTQCPEVFHTIPTPEDLAANEA